MLNLYAGPISLMVFKVSRPLKAEFACGSHSPAVQQSVSRTVLLLCIYQFNWCVHTYLLPLLVDRKRGGWKGSKKVLNDRASHYTIKGYKRGTTCVDPPDNCLCLLPCPSLDPGSNQLTKTDLLALSPWQHGECKERGFASVKNEKTSYR